MAPTPISARLLTAARSPLAEPGRWRWWNSQFGLTLRAFDRVRLGFTVFLSRAQERVAMLNYQSWIGRAVAYVNAFPRLPGEFEISGDVQPVIDDAAVDRLVEIESFACSASAMSTRPMSQPSGETSRLVASCPGARCRITPRTIR